MPLLPLEIVDLYQKLYELYLQARSWRFNYKTLRTGL